MHSLSALIAVTALLAMPAAATAQAAETPTAVGRGAAATVDLLATEAAVEALRRGANAVDAAVVAAQTWHARTSASSISAPRAPTAASG